MERHVFSNLEKWKNKQNRKPLVLLGPRQVGKTYALKRLGSKGFVNTVYINFEERPVAKAFFETELSPKRILGDLSIFAEAPIHPGKTLVIFDEIQEAPKALTSLKYFCEMLPEIHVAAAGSLLGLKMPKGSSFPVGKVEFQQVLPMTFMEFLQALGHADLAERIAEIPYHGSLPEPLHQRSNELLRLYYFVGGMPEPVASYATDGDYDEVRRIQKAILLSYQLDISKHAPASDIQKIFRIWESIPSQLARENKRFSYTAMQRGARGREYEAALQWLVDAGLVICCDRVNSGHAPLSGYVEQGIFKLFVLDVGLLAAMADLSKETLIQGHGVFTEFKGSFVENYVAQTLRFLELHPYYWHSEGKAEVDFVVDFCGHTLPIEAKSGVNVRSRSLHVFSEKYDVAPVVRMSLLPFQRTLDLVNIPLYAAEVLRGVFK